MSPVEHYNHNYIRYKTYNYNAQRTAAASDTAAPPPTQLTTAIIMVTYIEPCFYTQRIHGTRISAFVFCGTLGLGTFKMQPTLVRVHPSAPCTTALASPRVHTSSALWS